jgi:peptide alpha-N-acetyltransferase
MAKVGEQQQLPVKDQSIFQQMVSCYEKKLYKKGLKHAETLLAKHPNHGETLAMKGLLHKYTGDTEKGYELVKLGVRNAVRSHICWHVYGLIYRSDQNYKEAIKCYLNALRINPGNSRIEMDLSWLQIQMRDIPGFVQTRYKVLMSRPNLKPSWTAYAAANYMGEQYSVAYDIMTKLFESFSEEKERYEDSELTLFQNLCLEKQGKYLEGIDHLKKNEGTIVDKLSYQVKMAEYYVKSGQWAEAQEAWLALTISQTENYRYHTGMQIAYLELNDSALVDQLFDLKRLELPCTSLELTAEQLATLNSVYKNAAFAKSRATRKIVITLARGEPFRELLDQHCRVCLRDAVPALYHDVCSLFRSPDRLNPNSSVLVTEPSELRTHPAFVVAMDLVTGYVKSLKLNGTFDASPAEIDIETPTCLLWSLFLQSHLYEISGQLQEALAAIDACIEHTPTALDMYMKKGRILKQLGDLQGAASVIDGVRELDLQDRYLNNKATKYLLRADRMDDAMDRIAMFVKHNDDKDPQLQLADLQVNWYEVEAAESYVRLKNWGMALKKLYSVQAHFKQYVEDMFDFHNFSMRKTTLRMYLDLILMNDHVFSHKFHQRAARTAIKLFLYLIDTPEDIDGLGHLSAADRKKERAKLKKKKAKAEEKAKNGSDEKASAEAGTEKTNDKDVDEDPLGEKLLAKNWLDEAVSWSMSMMSVAGLCHPETLALMAEALLRAGKYIQVARVLRTGLMRCPANPSLTVMLVKLARRIRGMDNVSSVAPVSSLSPVVLTALTAEIDIALGCTDLTQFVTQYVTLAQEKRSLVYTIGAARCVLANASSKGASAAKQRALATVTDEAIWEGAGITVVNLEALVKFITVDLKAPTEAQVVKEKAAKHFPMASAFAPNPVNGSSANGSKQNGEAPESTEKA